MIILNQKFLPIADGIRHSGRNTAYRPLDHQREIFDGVFLQVGFMQCFPLFSFGNMTNQGTSNIPRSVKKSRPPALPLTDDVKKEINQYIQEGASLTGACGLVLDKLGGFLDIHYPVDVRGNSVPRRLMKDAFRNKVFYHVKSIGREKKKTGPKVGNIKHGARIEKLLIKHVIVAYFAKGHPVKYADINKQLCLLQKADGVPEAPANDHWIYRFLQRNGCVTKGIIDKSKVRYPPLEDQHQQLELETALEACYTHNKNQAVAFLAHEAGKRLPLRAEDFKKLSRSGSVAVQNPWLELTSEDLSSLSPGDHEVTEEPFSPPQRQPSRKFASLLESP